jgi:hypothetical protein
VSCGQLHEPGHGFHLHLPGQEHAPGGDGYQYVPVTGPGPAGEDPAAGQPQDGPGGSMPVPAAGQDQAGAGQAPPPRDKQPGRIRIAVSGAWDRHGYMIRPFAWGPAVDGASWVAHEMSAAHVLGYNPLAAVVTVFGGGLTAEVVTEIRNHKRKRRPKHKTIIRQQITAATAWALIAAGWTPAGWEDIVQWLALAGELALPGRFAHEARKARKEEAARRQREDERREPLAIEPPRRPDPRPDLFTGRFCQPGGELDGVVLENFRELPTGFMFELCFPVHTAHCMASVEALIVQIAKLYDVTRNDVSVSYLPDRPTENRCQVVIRTLPVLAASERQDPAYNRWDGACTYDPATGMIDLGLFHDGRTAHYLLHKPWSGAAMGMVCGIPGAGKTTTMHVIAADAGQAMLCSRCGARGDCGQCDPQRVIAVWMADPQEQPFSVWKDRADLTGWGPEGAVELLEFTDLAAARRGEFMSSAVWYDTDPVTGQPRRNTGKGWFDIAAGFPLILLPLDELPILARHPDQDLVMAAFTIIANGVNQWRKRGIHPLFGTQTLDTSQIRIPQLRDMIKYLNSIAHRVDEVTGNSGGITGDPRTLPLGEDGVGFIAGPDGRPGDRFNVKIMPETLKPGMTGLDIRHLAGKIERTPIAYDPGVLAAMDEWGVTHRQVFTEWRGRPGYGDAASLEPASPVLAAAGPGIGGLAYREDADKVLAALGRRPGAGIADLMEHTGLSLGAVGRALDALAAEGQVTKDADDKYTAA